LRLKRAADAHGQPDNVIVSALKCAALTFDHAGRRLVHGRLTAGAVQVTAALPTKATRIHH
jgi:AraC family transcriptional regulator